MVLVPKIAERHNPAGTLYKVAGGVGPWHYSKGDAVSWFLAYAELQSLCEVNR